MVWPAATISRIHCFDCSVSLPTTKKVAFTPYSSRIFSTSGVRAEGPSSKVR